MLHFKIDPTARIGYSLIRVQNLTMKANASIGHLNLINRLENLVLENDAVISNLNYIYGVARSSGAFQAVPERKSDLVLGAHSAITSRHLIDCTDQVTLEEFATLAGYRSTVLTHSIDFVQNVQSCGPIVIGSYSFVGTNCVLLRDTKIPSRCLIAAGSVVTDKTLESQSLIGGVPAKVLRPIPDDWLHFQRTVGRVD